MNNQIQIHYASGFEHKHYIAATREFEILRELDGRKGFFIKVFFVNDKVNGNNWRITWEAIKADAKDVIGVPIVLQQDLQHPEFSVQNFFAKGYVVDFILDEAKRELAVIARIIDVKTIRLIQEKKLKFTSPAVVARNNLSIENVDGVDLLHSWIALHLAIVENPAYGKADAVIHGTCTGKGDTCSLKLKQLSASEIAGLDDCVSKILSKKLGPGETPSDQDLAIAFSECKEKQGKSYGKEYKSTNNPPGSDSAKVGPLTQIPLLKRAELDQILNREHELQGKGFPDSTVLVMLMEEFGTELNEKDPAKQHRLQASLDYIASTLESINTGQIMRDGIPGYWINAKGMPVFIANNRTVDQAIKEQCPCQFLADEIDLVVSKEEADYRYAPTLEVQCSTCKFFNASTNSCQVVEGFIRPGFLSNKYEPRKKNALDVTERT